MSASTESTRATMLAVTWLAGLAGHEVGDYLIQMDCDATTKHLYTPTGRRALARHVATYTLAQTCAKTLALKAAGVRVPWRAVLVGQLVETVAHAVIDDTRLLERYAALVRKSPFWRLAGGGVNGRMLMDQAVHRGVQIPVGAVVTMLVAGGAR